MPQPLAITTGEAAAKQCCCQTVAAQQKSTDISLPAALQRMIDNGAHVPNLQKIYQLPPDKRDAALANLLQLILQRFAKHSEISDDRMRLALGFDRPQLMLWWQQAREKVVAARQMADV